MLPPEGKLLVLMLGGFTEDVVLKAKRRRPVIVRLLADTGGELSVAGRAGTKMGGVDAALLAADGAGKRAESI